MPLTQTIEKLFHRFLPSPFAIAVLLTLFTILLAWAFTEGPEAGSHLGQILVFWEKGIWNPGLIVFAYQMMLILVLGHILVLSKPMSRLIAWFTQWVTNGANAALWVALPTLLVSFFNWGLGLIFGAILARKVGEHAKKQGIAVNYPLLGACGYVGLMVWHGGISGSAPLKVAESGHLPALMGAVGNTDLLRQIPELVPTAHTIFNGGNLLVFALVLLLISTLVYVLGKNTTSNALPLVSDQPTTKPLPPAQGAERLNRTPWLAIGFGLLILVTFVLRYHPSLAQLNLTPNMLNFFMLGLAFVLHGSFNNFLKALENAIGDTAGILIQFPLYFGIMGIMSQSGMVSDISAFFVSISNETTLPLFTFFSAGLVNIFVPSGGGQWAVQGPLVIESALELGVPLPKAIMALAYGDQTTNMLQPFWALPLLAITKLKAKEILPYTLIFMMLGTLVYITGLLLFY